MRISDKSVVQPERGDLPTERTLTYFKVTSGVNPIHKQVAKPTCYGKISLIEIESQNTTNRDTSSKEFLQTAPLRDKYSQITLLRVRSDG